MIATLLGITEEHNQANPKENQMQTNPVHISLNNFAEVELTLTGADYLNQLNTKCNEQKWIYSDLFQFKTDYKQGDIHKEQLWALMEKFGSQLGLGFAVPFRDCRIKITQ